MLIYHGLCGYGGVFLINGKASLGFLLADNGYDVWLANVRGTRYSLKHKTLDNESSKYWDFSWHEIGVKDVPPSIDYIINETGQKKINIIAHSQGVTLFMAFMAELPEYNDKIIVMHALAPTISLKYTRNVILKVSAMFSKLIQLSVNLIGFYFVPFQSFITRQYIAEVCPANNTMINTCDSLLRLGLGWISKVIQVFCYNYKFCIFLFYLGSNGNSSFTFIKCSNEIWISLFTTDYIWKISKI